MEGLPETDVGHVSRHDPLRAHDPLPQAAQRVIDRSHDADKGADGVVEHAVSQLLVHAEEDLARFHQPSACVGPQSGARLVHVEGGDVGVRDSNFVALRATFHRTGTLPRAVVCGEIDIGFSRRGEFLKNTKDIHRSLRVTFPLIKRYVYFKVLTKCISILKFQIEASLK